MYQRLSLKNKKLIKMNKRINGFFKITAVCLCIVMFIAAVPVGAFALPNYDAQEIFNAFKNFTIENIPDSLKSGLIDLNDAVRIEQPDGYDVNSLILDFGDGEKTLYQYDEPIKFTDEEGYVHFIDSSLKSTVKCKNLLEWYAFENTANSVKTYFPWYVSTGVLTEFDGYSFEIIPAADINSRAVRPESSDITVEYPNAFGKGTTLQYVSLNDGVKENIILNSYNGKTVYEYKIRANGLTPKLTPDGDISLVNENHDVVFTISKVIMFDSAEVPNHSDNNSYELTEQKNGMWTLRVLLDDNFLNDENTVYPVTVDPSATTGNSNTAFDNQTYYSDNTNEHYDLFSSIGISENSYEHVTYLRLNDMTPFVAINPAKITGATLTLYSNSSSPSYDIDAFAYNFNPDVDIDSLEWLDIIDVQQAPDFYTTATLSDKVTLNIKSLFIAWLTAETKYYSRTNTMYKKDGLFLRASFDSYSVSPYKPLYFENVNSSIKAPCLTVSYVEDVSLETGYYYIQSGYYYEDARYLTASSNGLAIYDYTGNANQIWYVASNYDYAPAEELYGDYRIYNVSSMGYTECGSGNSVHLSNYQSDSFLWNEDCSFKILDQSNGYKRIVNLNDGSPVTLEVRNYSKDNGAPIVTNTVKGLDNQRWKFKKIEKVAVPVGSTSQTMVVGQNPKIISYMLSVNVGSTSDVTVTSSNSDVVSVTEHTLYGTSVNDHGNITLSANAPGSAVITARAAVTNDFNQTVYYNTYWNITVEGQSISLSETSINIYVGKHYDLEATTNLIGLEVSWSSSDTSVATVSQDGRVAGTGVGTAIITATIAAGAQASCEVNVTGYCRFDNSNTDAIIGEFVELLGDKKADVIAHDLIYINTTEECVKTIIDNDYTITKIANELSVHKAFIQTILMRELWCLNLADIAGDEMVQSYYNWKEACENWEKQDTLYQATVPYPSPPVLIKEDSSVGLGQIFAKVAIAAYNHAIDFGYICGVRKNADDWHECKNVWYSLKDDEEYNIRMSSINILSCIDEFGYQHIYDSYSAEQCKHVFTRYNANTNTINDYGEECYQYYLIFKKYT